MLFVRGSAHSPATPSSGCSLNSRCFRSGWWRPYFLAVFFWSGVLLLFLLRRQRRSHKYPRTPAIAPDGFAVGAINRFAVTWARITRGAELDNGKRPIAILTNFDFHIRQLSSSSK